MQKNSFNLKVRKRVKQSKNKHFSTFPIDFLSKKCTKLSFFVIMTPLQTIKLNDIFCKYVSRWVLQKTFYDFCCGLCGSKVINKNHKNGIKEKFKSNFSTLSSGRKWKIPTPSIRSVAAQKMIAPWEQHIQLPVVFCISVHIVLLSRRNSRNTTKWFV